MSKGPFPLGGYFHTPNSADATAEAQFEVQVGSFTTLMGMTPQFLTYYVDQAKPIGDWVSNASWQAYSAAQSPAAKNATPVIGLPMNSWVSGLTPDQAYKAFASGQYDAVIRGVVNAWHDQGFSTQYWRPGWEMNFSGMPSYAGTDDQTRSDWVAAFQHISTVLRQAGQADGTDVRIIWNPNVTNYDEVGVIQHLYPGNAYVDVIGADIYAGAFPYAPLYDWAKNDGTVDGSLAEWLSNPVNRTHYWTYPAATQWSNDGSNGHNLSLQTLLDFAKEQGKPFAVPETGAGSSDGGHDVSDDAAFPEWLAKTLTASGVPIAFVDVWDANADGNYDFSTPGAKPLEAAAWAKYFGAQGTSGADTLTVSVSEDAWQGDAQYIISVDGTQVGGVRTATASHAKGATEAVTLSGEWGSGAHSVGVTFLNDAYGGSSDTDRNLYVDSVQLDGRSAAPAKASLMSSGTSTFQVPAAADTLVLSVSEDAWQGDAQYTITVDGSQVGGIRTATASHAKGATETVTLSGNWGNGAHDIGISFLNDAYGGTSAMDRNLYMDAMQLDGRSATPAKATLLSNGTTTLQVPSASAQLTVFLAEDAYNGDASYAIAVDGVRVATGSATASNAAGKAQAVSIPGALTPGRHDIAVSFLNDLWGGTADTDRNLYVTGMQLGGAPVQGAASAFYNEQTHHVSVVVPQG